MKNNTANNIERVEKNRYQYALIITVLFPLWYIPALLAAPSAAGAVAVAWALLLFAGIAVTVRYLVRLRRIQSLIKSDPILNDALNNELYREYRYKSSAWAFGITVIILAILTVVLRYVTVDAYLLCMALVLLMVLTKNIAWLIYNRQ